MRATFTISTMAMGGAQRVLINMANYWADKGWKVSIIVFERSNMPYLLHEAVTVHQVPIESRSGNMLSSLVSNIKRSLAIRKAILATKPDAVISFIDLGNIRTIAATRFTRFPVIVSERIDPTVYRLPRAWESIRQVAYRFADAVVVQTPRAASHFSHLGKRVHIIPNPVIRPESKVPPYSMQKPAMVAAGRLEHQKGFDVLIRAFSTFSKEYPEWNLYIYGEGSLRKTLKDLTDSLGLAGCVHLPGQTQSLMETFEDADIFVLSSRYEGFPNVLCEAMASGVAAIAADCPSGPGDIITHKKNGILVSPENIDELSKAMMNLAASEELRIALGNQARTDIKRYSIDRVMHMWEQLILKNAPTDGFEK